MQMGVFYVSFMIFGSQNVNKTCSSSLAIWQFVIISGCYVYLWNSIDVKHNFPIKSFTYQDDIELNLYKYSIMCQHK